jgi:hypothetical protein
MARQIKESDWKVFRRLHGIALERFCQRVIEEIRSVTASRSSGYHDRYLKLYALIRKRDKEMARVFDNLRRSEAFFLLTNIKRQGLLTDEELMQLSAETREAVELIDSINRP